MASCSTASVLFKFTNRSSRKGLKGESLYTLSADIDPVVHYRRRQKKSGGVGS